MRHPLNTSERQFRRAQPSTKKTLADLSREPIVGFILIIRSHLRPSKPCARNTGPLVNCPRAMSSSSFYIPGLPGGGLEQYRRLRQSHKARIGNEFIPIHTTRELTIVPNLNTPSRFYSNYAANIIKHVRAHARYHKPALLSRKNPLSPCERLIAAVNVSRCRRWPGDRVLAGGSDLTSG